MTTHGGKGTRRQDVPRLGTSLWPSPNDLDLSPRKVRPANAYALFAFKQDVRADSNGFVRVDTLKDGGTAKMAISKSDSFETGCFGCVSKRKGHKGKLTGSVPEETKSNGVLSCTYKREVESRQETTKEGNMSNEEVNKFIEMRQNASETAYENRLAVVFKEILSELSTQNFDAIKFASYRTASKLRYVQKRTFLHQIDIWNVIEAFREGNLNAPARPDILSMDYAISVLNRLYSHLKLRISSLLEFSPEQCIEKLASILYGAFASQDNILRTNAFKVGLVCLCNSKLSDKLRYLFTLCSDSDGSLDRHAFDQVVQDLLAVPSCLREAPSFGYSSAIASSCFTERQSVDLPQFLETLCSSNNPPQFLSWLHVLWRISSAESVSHTNSVCQVCNRRDFNGLRYLCNICSGKYTLCQNCFWRGRTSRNHEASHPTTEFQNSSKKSEKSPVRSLSNSLKRSFSCSSSKYQPVVTLASECNEKRVDLTHVVPATPLPKMMNGVKVLPEDKADDEHRLIARYAARLAADAERPSRSTSELNAASTCNRAQRELVAELEAKNKQILAQIERVKNEANSDSNPTLLAELKILRARRDELENRMCALQESRRELMIQLESLMTLLKTSPSHSHGSQSNAGHMSPKSPVRSEGSRSLRNDLLLAADSLTNAMSSLVRDLHSGESDEEEEEDEVNWMKEKEYEEQFMMELAAREAPAQEEKELYDNEPSALERNVLLEDLQTKITTEDVETDAESYIRTDDDDDGTDWEEAMRRWVNR